MGLKNEASVRDSPSEAGGECAVFINAVTSIDLLQRLMGRFEAAVDAHTKCVYQPGALHLSRNKSKVEGLSWRLQASHHAFQVSYLWRYVTQNSLLEHSTFS